MAQFIAEHKNQLPTLADLSAHSGLEFMQAILAGKLSGPPICRVINFRLHQVDQGRVAFRGTPLFDHMNPMSTVHGGWYGTLLDSAMACAVMTIVPQGSIYTTMEFKVNILRAIPLETEAEAVGTVQHAGRRSGVANGELRGVVDDKLYATGSTTCMIMPAPADMATRKTLA